MNSRDLVNAAIAHQETRRLPRRIDMCDDAWQAIRERVGAVSIDEFFHNDVIQISPPWWDWHELGTEWRGADFPRNRERVHGRGDYKGFVDAVAAARDCGRYVLVAIYGSHFEKAYFARGIENFLADLAGEPSAAKAFLTRIIERNLVMLENVLAIAGIDGVLLGSDWGSQCDLLMSPEIWREAIAPGEQREYDLIRAYGKHVWIHSCGCIERIIPDLVAMGVDVLNPVQPECMDLAALKRRYGDRLTFWGGLSTQRTLPLGSPQDVRQEARALRSLMAAGGGYIFAPAQGLQHDVPFENILALRDAAAEELPEPCAVT